MKIIEIAIENYRGIKTEQKIPLNSFSSIVGKNDSGKPIVLNAIASYLNLKDNPISVSDFNDTAFVLCYYFLTPDLSRTCALYCAAILFSGPLLPVRFLERVLSYNLYYPFPNL